MCASVCVFVWMYVCVLSLSFVYVPVGLRAALPFLLATNFPHYLHLRVLFVSGHLARLCPRLCLIKLMSIHLGIPFLCERRSRAAVRETERERGRERKGCRQRQTLRKGLNCNQFSRHVTLHCHLRRTIPANKRVKR